MKRDSGRKSGEAIAESGEASANATRRSRLAILPIILLALSLRLWGIGWGLPDRDRLLSYHPDEGPNLILGVLDKDGAPRPHLSLGFYNYGGFYFHLWQGASAVNRSYGLINLPQTRADNRPTPDSFAALILVGRLLTVLCGVVTVWLIYLLGERLYNRRAGLIAGIIYAVMPAAVVHGHYATVDVPATLFVCLALLCASSLLKKATPGATAIAGLTCGLAAATKYNCAIVLFAPLTSLWLGMRARSEPPSRTGLRSLLVLGGTTFGFILGCPGILVDFDRFRENLLFELSKSGQGMDALFAGTGNGWLYHLTVSLHLGLSVPLLILALASAGYALKKRTVNDWLLLSFLVPYYLLIGWAQVRFLRYVIPILPVLALFAGRMLTEWRPKKLFSSLPALVGAVAIFSALFCSLAMDRLMAIPDSRDVALSAIRKDIPLGATIAFAKTPWYWSPPLSPLFTAPDSRVRRNKSGEDAAYAFRMPAENTEWDAAVLDPPPPSVVVLSDLESEDALRLHQPNALRFMNILTREYLRRDFQNVPSFAGISLGKAYWVPNDWLYTYPRITLYVPREK